MEIEDMSVESIEKFLEKKESIGEKVFQGMQYTFKVQQDGDIHVYDKGDNIARIVNGFSLDALHRAVDKSKGLI